MSLPLCITSQPDSLVWLVEKSGQFSIKSGYKCLCEDPQASEPDSESAEVQRSFWKGVWKLNIPGKIKHFLWKSCTNSLPTKNNLLKRIVISKNVCHLCSEHPEDVMHAMWRCSKVRQVWQRSFGWLDHNQVAEGSFPNLVRLIQTKPRMFPLFAVTAWVVWHHRNKSQLQDVSIPLNRLAMFAETYLQNYTTGHGQRLPPVRSATGAVKWRPPSVDSAIVEFEL
nr:putative ribonuclease h protein [Quercus suber]